MSDLVHQCESKIVLRYKWGTDVYNNSAKIAILLCAAPKKRKACNSPELHAFHLMMYPYFSIRLLHLLEVGILNVVAL